MLTHPIRTSFAFEDVSIVPAYSTIMPGEANTRTRLTATISLEEPIMAAAMDTVTERAMAETMARKGGLGVIHRNLSPEAQRCKSQP